MSQIKTNTAALQELLNTATNLPKPIDTSDATATSSKILSGYTAYVKDKMIAGSIPNKTASDVSVNGKTVNIPAGNYENDVLKSVGAVIQATPSVSINSSGKITATSTQTEGYVFAGTKNATKQLTTQAAKTVTPTKSVQTAVASGVYTTGAIKVAAIPSQYVDNSGVTATESDVLCGKKFGASGSVKTGTMTNNGAISKTMDGINTKSTTIPAGYTTGGTVSLDDTIDNAVNSAITALTDKGVTVPDGTNVTGLADLIAAIEAGGAVSGEYIPIEKYFTYSVDPIPSQSYGFKLNDNGYYESQNMGAKSSYAICRINLEVFKEFDLTFDVINYAESSCDYGLFGNLDTALNLNANADSNVKQSFSGKQSPDVVSLTYENVPAGNHFIDVKFIKDNGMNFGNDSIQFKVNTATQYISEEYYPMLQRIESDLVPANIIEGVEIFGVAGIAAISTGTWGLITPASTDTVTIKHGLGKRPVVWGFLYASSFDNVSEELCGHRTYIRQDAATGEYTKTVGSFSQPGWNNISTYTQYGTSTHTYIDTEESDELKVPYQQIYANKNFLKFNPQSTRGRSKIAVGDTYIWYVLGTD